METIDEQRKAQRRVLYLIGIPLWQRLQSKSIEKPVSNSSEPVVTSSDTVAEIVANSSPKNQEEPVEIIVGKNSSGESLDDPLIETFPTTINAIYDLRVAPVATKNRATSTSPILLIRLSDKPCEPAAQLLLERMMSAIDRVAEDWEIHDLIKTAGDSDALGVPATDLKSLCAEKKPSAIVLLVPEARLQALSDTLIGCCDPIQASADNIGHVGHLPGTRISFCCLADPDDLLADGTRKRQAWNTLQGLHRATLLHNALTSDQ